MKTIKVSHSDLTVSSVVLGLMRIAGMSDADIRSLYDAAVDSGVTMIDHADVYGGAPHVCEARFGDAVKLSATDRGRIPAETSEEPAASRASTEQAGATPGSSGRDAR